MDKVLLINQSSGHNKFWIAEVDPQTNDLNIRWGRIGTKGQSQNIQFSSSWSAESTCRKKANEKTQKGYRRCSEIEFEKLGITATIVGTQNKSSGINWTSLTNNNGTIEFQVISEEDLVRPDFEPGILIHLETRKKYNDRSKHTLLFTADAVYSIGYQIGYAKPEDKVEKSNELYEFVLKVEEAIGKSFT